MQRLTFGQAELMDGINLVALARGLFGVAEVVGSIRDAERQGSPPRVRLAQMLPARNDLRRMPGPILRGSTLGSFFGALPGTGLTISSFLSCALERRIARQPQRFGNGAIEGVAGAEPDWRNVYESVNPSQGSSASQLSFIGQARERTGSAT